MTAPIYVPSYHRADPARTPTVALLERAGLPYTLVVEPDEEAAYRRAFPADRFPGMDLGTTPSNGRGMVGVRADMLAMARMTGVLWYWQIDDDVAGFSSYSAEAAIQPVTRGVTVPHEGVDAGTALARIEAAVADYPHVAIASPITGNLAELREPGILFPSARLTRSGETVLVNREAMYSFMLTRTDTAQLYDPAFTLRSGVDFALAHLTAGWDILTSLSIRAWYALPIPSASSLRGRLQRSLEGGLADVYAREGAKERAIVQLHTKWPDSTEARLGGLYPPFRILWDRFPPHH